VAENERTNIRQRQAEGIKAARLAGKHLGRPSKPLPPLYGAAVDKFRSGELNMRKAAMYCGMSCGAFRYHVMKEGQET
jgi:DNA invertase Pin-like site-specific DNA recombinase